MQATLETPLASNTNLTSALPVTVGNLAPVSEAQASLRAALRSHMRPCTMKEKRYAELYVLYRNQIRAYYEGYDVPNMSRRSAAAEATSIHNRPWVRAYVQELDSAAAAAVVIDVAAILAMDARIVEASALPNAITSHVWQCCRYCNGVDHDYQWIDSNEFCVALAANYDSNAERAARKLPPLPEPSDNGGYGFEVSAEPNVTCPKCEGRGVQITIINDTTKLDGPAAAWYKGVKETKNGIEVLLHDVDKAKERLLRAAGVFKDDAASVARGAAAGAAAGAAVGAAAAAARVDQMTAEQAGRLYLELVG